MTSFINRINSIIYSSLTDMNLLFFSPSDARPPQTSPGSWDARKGRLKNKFPFLTDDDLMLNANNRNEMFGNLLHKLDKTPEELHAIIIAL